MIQRFENTFALCRAQKRAALVSFIMAGDPDFETSAQLLCALPQAGADVVELGMPFSDPMADGPSIQAAGLRALKAGQTMVRTLQLATRFRAHNPDTPLVLMGYYNPIYIYGAARFAADAAAAGVDGVIVVDLPPEESDELTPHLQAHDIAFVPLVAPTTPQNRLAHVLAHGAGFAYFVSIAGVTGTRTPDFESLRGAIETVRQAGKLPVCLGFGIRTLENARAAARVADGVVVGSALVDALAQSLDEQGKAQKSSVASVLAQLNALKAALV